MNFILRPTKYKKLLSYTQGYENVLLAQGYRTPHAIVTDMQQWGGE
jgi:hypothetical protein